MLKSLQLEGCMGRDVERSECSGPNPDALIQHGRENLSLTFSLMLFLQYLHLTVCLMTLSPLAQPYKRPIM